MSVDVADWFRDGGVAVAVDAHVKHNTVSIRVRFPEVAA